MTASSRRFISIYAAMLAALTAASASPLPMPPLFQRSTPAPGSTLQQVQRTLDNRRMVFIENKGQWDRQAKFLLKSKGLNMWITERGVRYDLFSCAPATTTSEGNLLRMNPNTEPPAMTRRGHVIGISFEGSAFAPVARGTRQQPGAHNYFIGNDRAKWASGVRLFAEARLENIYDGVDALFYLDEGRPRYDLIVAPGANPAQVKMKIEGSNGVSVNADGSLSIMTTMGMLQQRQLYAYQEIDGVRRQVACRFVVEDHRKVRFEVGNYDHGHALVIDPLIYATYLGGAGYETGSGIAVDNGGNAYITGVTTSIAFPTVNEYQTDKEFNDAFVTKLVYTGSDNVVLAYSTYLGGANTDNGSDIGVDNSGNAYIIGYTHSTDFPMMNEYQTFQGVYDAFVTKLSYTGNGNVALAYSTCLGGSDDDKGVDIAVDAGGIAYVTGITASTNFPILYEYQSDERIEDTFVSKLAYDGFGSVELVYSTYLGGYFTDEAGAIAVDGGGSAYIIGTTTSSDFPTVKRYQSHQGERDVYVAKLSHSGTSKVSLAYSTFLGGEENEFGYDITVYGNSVYLTGYTASTDFPTENFYQQDQGGNDAFVTKLTLPGAGNLTLGYSTYLGGTATDIGFTVAVDANGNAYVTGSTTSTNFPTVNPFQTYQGMGDAFVTKLVQNGSSIVEPVYSTYLGGSKEEYITDMVLDNNGNAYLVGVTASDNFPTLNQYQGYQQYEDAFIVKVVFPFQLDVPAGPDSNTLTSCNFTVIPNPASDQLRCNFSLSDGTPVTISIYTADGRMISVPVYAEQYERGTHSREIEIADLPRGVYSVRVMAGKNPYVRQFVVVR